MKKLRKLISVLASLAVMGAGFVSCSGDDETVIVQPSVKVDAGIVITGQTAVKIAVGDTTQQLTASIYPESAAGNEIEWVSSDTSVLTVENGLVTALKASDSKVQVWAQFTGTETKSNIIEYQVLSVIPKVTGVTLVNAPSKTKYATGTALALEGMKISVSYDHPLEDDEDYPLEITVDGTNKSLFSYTGFDSSAAVTGQTVTVTYVPAVAEFASESVVKTVSFDVDIIDASVTSVSVKEGSKTSYNYGENLDVTLLVEYSESSLNEELPATADGVTMTAGGSAFTWDSVTADDFVNVSSVTKDITFTYGSVSTASSTEITVNSVPATSITILASASTVKKNGTASFSIGQILPADATIAKMTQSVNWSVVDSDDTGASIWEDTGVLDMSGVTKDGTVKVYATANEVDGISVYETITIPVFVKEIAVTTAPSKTEYLSTDTALDSDGLVVTATQSDDTTIILDSSEYTLGSVDFTTAGSKTVSVTLSEDESVTTSFNVNVTKVYVHTVNMAQASADEWTEAYPYSKVTSNSGDATKVTIDGTETGFEPYVYSHFWFQKGAVVLQRADKKALFLNRAASSGDGSVADQSPVLFAAEVAGKYRIEADIFATSKNNTSRMIYIKTLEEDTASADGTTTQVSAASGTEMNTVLSTTHKSADKHTISYDYTGSSPYSVVGIDLTAGEAVYVSAVRIYTEQETLAEPEITIHASSVTITDSEGAAIAVPDGGSSRTVALKREKTSVTYQLNASIRPAAAVEQTLSWSLSPESENITLSSDGLITVSPELSENYTGTVTVTVDGTSVTDSIALTVDASKRLLTAEDVPSVSTDNSQIAPSTGTATLTAVFDETVLEESVSFIWQKASSASGEYSDIEGATSKTYEFSSDAEGSVYFRFVVTGAESGVTVASEAVSVYVGSKPLGGSITFDTSDVTSPTIVNNAVLNVTVSGSGKDYFPDKVQKALLKMDSKGSVKFTTPGSTDLTYTLTVNYINIKSSAGSYKLLYTENNEEKTYATLVELPVAGSVGSTSDAAVIATADSITVPGGTTFTLKQNKTETYLTGITIE
ncbi:MAG: bacterial Ig-like domain-containing protein [Treponema sp.]|nr:bacterial Ig-like domain-containing protein [Treponema sp.]